MKQGEDTANNLVCIYAFDSAPHSLSLLIFFLFISQMKKEKEKKRE